MTKSKRISEARRSRISSAPAWFFSLQRGPLDRRQKAAPLPGPLPTRASRLRSELRRGEQRGEGEEPETAKNGLVMVAAYPADSCVRARFRLSSFPPPTP